MSKHVSKEVMGDVIKDFERRSKMIETYREAYRNACKDIARILHEEFADAEPSVPLCVVDKIVGDIWVDVVTMPRHKYEAEIEEILSKYRPPKCETCDDNPDTLCLDCIMEEKI